MTRKIRVFADDRGAVLVHVALAVLVIVAFTTFVADYGVLWASRRQAQNSADAGAMAGAVALAYDDATNLTSTGAAKESAFAATQANLVWGQAPSVVPATDITFLCPSCASLCPDGSDAICVKVDVYRTLARDNPLPMFFGHLVGLTSQNIQATATAKVSLANSTDCLKPWGVIDKWAEHYPVNPAQWTVLSTFDKYDKQGNLDPAITTPDEYIPPTTTSFGTGFHPKDANGVYTSDYGLQLNLKLGSKNDFNYATGWFAALSLFDSMGGNDYRDDIKHCVGTTYTIGDELPIQTQPGQLVGPTAQGVEQDADSLVNQDPGAYWDPTLVGGRGGVAGSAFATSPRIVPIPLVDPDIMASVNKGGRTTVPISNIMGFFVEGYDHTTKSVTGRLMQMPGFLSNGSGGPVPPGTFLQTIVLIR